MGLLDRLFGYNKAKQNTVNRNSESNVKTGRNENCDWLMQFSSLAKNLLDEKRYIAKSEYLPLVEQYKETVTFFDVLIQSSMLVDFCAKNGIEQKRIEEATKIYKDIESIFDKHN